MKQFRRFSAMMLAVLMLMTTVFALAEEASSTASPAPGDGQVQEPTPEETPAEAQETEQVAPEAAAPTNSPAPAFAPLPETKKADMPKPAANAKAEAIVIDPNGTALFELPGHESALLENLEGGTVLTLLILGQTWSKVSLGEKVGYVPTYALSFGFGTAQPNIALVTAPNGKLTLRAEMTTKSESLGVIPSGRAVLMLAKGETFSLVRHENKEGYLLTAHLKEVPANTTLGLYTEVVSLTNDREANVRIRAKASRNAEAYTTVKSGSFVLVLEVKDDWAQVEYEGFHGYMMGEYLKRFD